MFFRLYPRMVEKLECGVRSHIFKAIFLSDAVFSTLWGIQHKAEKTESRSKIVTKSHLWDIDISYTLDSTSVYQK